MNPPITEETIIACSRDASFCRGKKYFDQGRVTKVSSEGSEWSATVVGTDNYRVRLEPQTFKARVIATRSRAEMSGVSMSLP